jgi:Protein of unknown function (DUF2877)
MRLCALSAGEHAPRGRFNGAVHSVFRRACNIRLDDGRMLALLGPEQANLPHGIRVATAPAFAFADHLRVGQRAGCRADVLRLGGAGLSIDLCRARPWRSDLSGLGTNLDREVTGGAWRVAWHALSRHERTGLVSPEATGRDLHKRGSSPCDALRRAVFREGLRLTRATRFMRAEAAARAIDRLIGRGPGLTPAGDDLIVGFLGGLRAAAGDRPEQLVFARSLGETVVRLSVATNEISRAFLRYAAAGSVAEPLALLAGCITEAAAPDEVERAAARAMAFGHTSGADATFGLLLGLASWRAAWPFSQPAARIEGLG